MEIKGTLGKSNVASLACSHTHAHSVGAVDLDGLAVGVGAALIADSIEVLAASVETSHGSSKEFSVTLGEIRAVGAAVVNLTGS